MNKDELQGKTSFKLLNENFDNELNNLLIKLMSEGTILGNLARINYYYGSINNSQNNEYIKNNEWQFSNDDENSNSKILIDNMSDSCSNCDDCNNNIVWQFEEGDSSG